MKVVYSVRAEWVGILVHWNSNFSGKNKPIMNNIDERNALQTFFENIFCYFAGREINRKKAQSIISFAGKCYPKEEVPPDWQNL